MVYSFIGTGIRLRGDHWPENMVDRRIGCPDNYIGLDTTKVAASTAAQLEAFAIAVSNNAVGPVEAVQGLAATAVAPAEALQPIAEGFPFSPILDAFNRADENPLSQGGLWDRITSGSGNDYKLVSNQILGVGNTPTGYRLDSVGWTDCEAYATVIATTGITGAAGGVVARVTPGSTTYTGYSVWIVTAAGSNNDAILIARGTNIGAGVPGTTLLNIPLGRDWGAGDMVGVRCLGSTIQAWYKPSGGAWTYAGAAVDTTYSTGAVGLTSNQSNFTWDDFGGGPVSPGIAAVLSFEALTSQVTQTAQDAVESLKGLAKTQAVPLESGAPLTGSNSHQKDHTKGISATVVERAEILQGLHATVTDRLEAALGLRATVTDPLDSTGKLATGTVQAFLEALQTLVKPAAADPVDSLQAVTASRVDPLDSTGKLASQTVQAWLETLQGVTANRADAYEAAAAITAPRVIRVEALQRIAAIAAGPFEASTNSVTTLAATAAFAIETLAVVEKTASSPLEMTVALKTTVAAALEALQKLQAAGVNPVDALASASASANSTVDALAELAASATDPGEAIVGVAGQTAMIPWEYFLGVAIGICAIAFGPAALAELLAAAAAHVELTAAAAATATLTDEPTANASIDGEPAAAADLQAD